MHSNNFALDVNFVLNFVWHVVPVLRTSSWYLQKSVMNISYLKEMSLRFVLARDSELAAHKRDTSVGVAIPHAKYAAHNSVHVSVFPV